MAVSAEQPVLISPPTPITNMPNTTQYIALHIAHNSLMNTVGHLALCNHFLPISTFYMSFGPFEVLINWMD